MHVCWHAFGQYPLSRTLRADRIKPARSQHSRGESGIAAGRFKGDETTIDAVEPLRHNDSVCNPPYYANLQPSRASSFGFVATGRDVLLVPS